MQGPMVKVIIDKKGNAAVEMIGFQGVGCSELAEKLKSVGPVTSESNKPEFYEENQSGNALETFAG
jgi:ribosome-interacting GTPase 1